LDGKLLDCNGLWRAAGQGLVLTAAVVALQLLHHGHSDGAVAQSVVAGWISGTSNFSVHVEDICRAWDMRCRKPDCECAEWHLSDDEEAEHFELFEQIVKPALAAAPAVGRPVLEVDYLGAEDVMKLLLASLVEYAEEARLSIRMPVLPPALPMHLPDFSPPMDNVRVLSAHDRMLWTASLQSKDKANELAHMFEITDYHVRHKKAVERELEYLAAEICPIRSIKFTIVCKEGDVKKLVHKKKGWDKILPEHVHWYYRRIIGDPQAFECAICRIPSGKESSCKLPKGLSEHILHDRPLCMDCYSRLCSSAELLNVKRVLDGSVVETSKPHKLGTGESLRYEVPKTTENSIGLPKTTQPLFYVNVRGPDTFTLHRTQGEAESSESPVPLLPYEHLAGSPFDHRFVNVRMNVRDVCFEPAAQEKDKEVIFPGGVIGLLREGAQEVWMAADLKRLSVKILWSEFLQDHIAHVVLFGQPQYIGGVGILVDTDSVARGPGQGDASKYITNAWDFLSQRGCAVIWLPPMEGSENELDVINESLFEEQVTVAAPVSGGVLPTALAVMRDLRSRGLDTIVISNREFGERGMQVVAKVLIDDPTEDPRAYVQKRLVRFRFNTKLQFTPLLDEPDVHTWADARRV